LRGVDERGQQIQLLSVSCFYLINLFDWI
jgi:hypothetical protein